VFRVHNKVADSGDVVIHEQGFSIVDTHEPAIAISLLSLSPRLLMVNTSSHRNQKFLVGPHQEVCRFDSPGLNHIKSVRHCEISRNERHTSTSFLPSPAILCHLQATITVIYLVRYHGLARRWWRGEGVTGVWWGARGLGDLTRGTPFS
jgi:hypothetical protein